MDYFFKNRITLESRDEIGKYLNSYPHDTSGLSFTSLYMWRDQNFFSYEIINGFLCIAGISNFEGYKDDHFVFPILPESEDYDRDEFRKAFEAVLGRFRQLGEPFVMRLLPDSMREMYEEIMPGRFLMLNDRANHDYVYLTSELSELKGRKFHGKKNHLNRFNKEFDQHCEVIPMNSDLTDEALELLAYIDAKKQLEGFAADMLAMEADVLRDIMPDFEKLGFRGCALRIDGKLQAYAFGGMLGDDTVVEHIEKANIDFPGIYQKINSEFCRLFRDSATYVNREEDMGLAGLRKSKTSYKPVRMVEKYVLMLADDKEAVERYGFDEDTGY